MRVLFQPFGDRPPLPGQLVEEHGDGSATLRLDVPGGTPAMVNAREGDGPGMWVRVAPAPKCMATLEPAPVAVSRPRVARVKQAPPPKPAPQAETAVATSEVQTCKFCFRRHRGENYMYCSACEAAGVPVSQATPGKHGKRY